MTRSLLVLLALSAPNPVPAARALEAIWPNVDPAKSRARLRTAASQIRKTVGSHCIDREGDSLVLRDVWVDTRAFELLVGRARRQFLSGHVDRGISAARDAVGLYAGDLFDDGTSADWLTPRREHFRRLHREVLLETAEAALAVGRHDDAVSAASQIAHLLPANERACRVLMLGYQRLGEAQQSFLAFDKCRSALAEMIGTDPSAETLNVHQSLLSSHTARQAPPPFVGRADAMERIRLDADKAFETNRGRFLQIAGPEGAGKSRLLDQISRRMDARTLLVRVGAADTHHNDALLNLVQRTLSSNVKEAAGAGLSVDQPTIVCLDDVQWASEAQVTKLANRVARLRAPLLVIGATTGTPPKGEGVIRLRSLSPTEVATLAGAVAGGNLTGDTVAAITEHAGRFPGAVIGETARLRDGGLLQRSAAGISRVETRGSLVGTPSPSARVEAARESLPLHAIHTLGVLAVLDEPISLPELERLDVIGEPVAPALDALLDTGLLIREGSLYTFESSELQSAAYHWLRSSLRRRLHAQIGREASGILSHSTRLRHWVAGGSPRSLDGPPVVEDAPRTQPESPLRLALPLDAIDGVTMFVERLSTLMAIMQRAQDDGDLTTARHASDLSISLAETHHRESLPELYRWRAMMMVSDEDALSWCIRAEEVVDPGDLVERSHISSARGRIMCRWSQHLATESHRIAVDLADQSGDLERRVRSRAWLVESLLSGRNFTEAHDIARTTADLADQSEDKVLQAIGLRTIARPSLAMLSGTATKRTLRRAWPGSRLDPDVHASVAFALAQSSHDAGEPDARDAENLSELLCEGTRRAPMWHTLAAHLAIERGEFDQCAKYLAEGDEIQNWAAVNDTWRLMIQGRMHAALGRHSEAVASFEQGERLGRHSGATLYAGECAARRVMSLAHLDVALAEIALGTIVPLVGAGAFPREQALLVLARGHVAYGNGDMSTAQVLASTAQKILMRAKLPHPAAEVADFLTLCHRSQASEESSLQSSNTPTAGSPSWTPRTLSH